MRVEKISGISTWLISVVLLVTITVTNAAEPKGNALLWKVSKPGYQTSYVFGTVHADRAPILAVGNKVLVQIENADMFFAEVNLGNQAQMLFVQESMFLPKNQSLADLVGDDLAEATRKRFRDHGMGSAIADRLRPWSAAVMLSYPKMSLGIPLDMYLFNLAQQKGKDVGGLETVQEQLSVFDGLGAQGQKLMLQRAVENYHQAHQTMESLFNAYQRQDLRELESIAFEQMDQEPAQLVVWTKEDLLNKRNLRFLNRMLPHMKHQSIFVAVGALHLPGDQGLLALLQAKGFQVNPIRVQ